MAEPIFKQDKKTETARGVLRWAGQMMLSLVIFGGLLFLSAGRLDWRAGWVFFSINLLVSVLSAVILIPRRPEMLAERSKARKGTKGWERFLVPGLTLGTLGVIVTAGLDARFGWSIATGGGLWGLGLILALGSQIFALWAMAANPFFALTVRIQHDRGHSVVSGGPYRLVRHPGYLGAVVYNLAAPLVLGSLWAFLPALFTIGLILIRTGLEDRTLRAELPHYPKYAAETRYRLIPGIW